MKTPRFDDELETGSGLECVYMGSEIEYYPTSDTAYYCADLPCTWEKYGSLVQIMRRLDIRAKKTVELRDAIKAEAEYRQAVHGAVEAIESQFMEELLNI